MMYRDAQYAGYETSQRSAQLSSYADYASISDWAVEAVSWANAVGLMNGRTASTIVPTGTITRAEAATILMQFGEKRTEVTLLPSIPDSAVCAKRQKGRTRRGPPFLLL